MGKFWHRSVFIGLLVAAAITLEDPTDQGGTAVFMAQHYGNVPPNLDFSTMPPTPVPDRSYTNAQWDAEMERVNFDRLVPTHQFRAGDLVEVRAQERRFFGGKLNVNENHIKEDVADFELHLVTAGYGLPTPADVELADIWTGPPATGHVLFDATRASGGGFYQGSLVRLKNVRLVSDPAGWEADGTVRVADVDGRTFGVKLGLRAEFDVVPAPTGFFHVTGIFDQEDLSNLATDTYVAGYRLWVTDPAAIDVALPGDYNANGVVDAADYTVWRNTLGSADDLRADGDCSGKIDAGDSVLLPVPHFQHQPADAAWLERVAQLHGHVGPWVVAGVRLGDAARKAAGADGYFDLRVECRGPFAEPPQACFLDGLQIATGAALGKRSLVWKPGDQIVVEVVNTRSNRRVEVRPSEKLLGLLSPPAQPAARAAATPPTGERQGPPDAAVEAVAREISVMPDGDMLVVTLRED